MAPTKITVKNDGSLFVEGELEVVDQTGKPFGLAGRSAVSFCRCGLSEKKPFCDGAHKRQGFQSKIEAFDLPPVQPKP
jgi:CDGSH-type Zn-finger protein